MKTVKIFVVIMYLSTQLLGSDVEAPLPYDSESPASTACIGKLNTFYTIVSNLLSGGPVFSTLKRNDVIVPFIQTTSVFTPLSVGTKTVKYRVTGSYIQDSARTFKSYAENTDYGIIIDTRWKPNDSSISFYAAFDTDCSGSARSINSGTSFFIETNNKQGGFSIPAPRTLCSNKTQTLAQKINEVGVNSFSLTTNGVSASDSEKEIFRTEILAMVNSSTTINDLCVFWGL